MQNLKEDIINQLGKEMQEEIDFEILAGMLEGIGWHKVRIPRFYNNKHAIDIRLWCELYVKNPFETKGSTFVFENKGDAVNFTLRWL